MAKAKDEFYAKYVPNETYETSTTKTTPLMVYIKSAQLQIPVIADADSPVHTGSGLMRRVRKLRTATTRPRLRMTTISAA